MPSAGLTYALATEISEYVWYNIAIMYTMKE
jgi:hypothetical protein